MSPAMAQAGAGSAAKDVKRESATARLLGSGMCHTHIVPRAWGLRSRTNSPSQELPELPS